jgi:SP family general alpha glucoside:H+ symporter-like MFS transporter
MSNDTEKHTSATEIEDQPTRSSEPVYDVDEKVDYDRAGAIEAERVEHDMTVIQAVKAYPAASWWAFVMSCTIVSTKLCPLRGKSLI